MSKRGEFNEPSPKKYTSINRKSHRKKRPPSHLDQFSCKQKLYTFSSEDLIHVSLSDSQGSPNINNMISGDWASNSTHENVPIDEISSSES